MDKRTTIYLDTVDLEAIAAIKADQGARGYKVTDAAAVRYALREMLRRLTPKRRARPQEEAAP